MYGHPFDAYNRNSSNQNSSTRPNVFHLSDISNEVEILPALSLGYWLATIKLRKCPRPASIHEEICHRIRCHRILPPNTTVCSSHDVRLPNVFPILCIDGIVAHCFDISFNTMRYDCNNFELMPVRCIIKSEVLTTSLRTEMSKVSTLLKQLVFSCIH